MGRLADWVPPEYNYCGRDGRRWVRKICDEAGKRWCDCMSNEQDQSQSTLKLCGTKRVQRRITIRKAEIANSAADVVASFNRVLSRPTLDEQENDTLQRLKEQVQHLAKLSVDANHHEKVLFQAYEQLEEDCQEMENSL